MFPHRANALRDSTRKHMRLGRDNHGSDRSSVVITSGRAGRAPRVNEHENECAFVLVLRRTASPMERECLTLRQRRVHFVQHVLDLLVVQRLLATLTNVQLTISEAQGALRHVQSIRYLSELDEQRNVL